MKNSLDKRTNAYRPDLADASLQGAVKAKKFAEPHLLQCLSGVVPMLENPSASAQQVSQLRYGEFFDVFEKRDDGFYWIQNRADNYVGYVRDSYSFSDTISSLSHRVGVLRTFIYTEPNLKAPVCDAISLGSFVSVLSETADFYEISNHLFVFKKHIVTTEESLCKDIVSTAGKLLGVPYLWGGRTPMGIDCSGLIQLTLELASFEAPRDSDLQRAAFGKPLTKIWKDYAWKRGDIVFFNGHVGIMTDAGNMIHANAFSMDVAVEPLASVVKKGFDILAVGNPL
ncbi:MAG: C40 family peptidase [Alphaproteobacteria bacterium]|nr:C40 family peptidase [Alphaproteobacteria bacterium]